MHNRPSKDMSIVETTAVLPDNTRVWVYQADQPFESSDVPAVRQSVREFVQQWISHNRQLRAYGDVYHDRFIVLMVDEGQADASGCSIDKSVYFLKALQQQYGVDLFNRMRFSYMQGDTVRTVDRATFERLYQEGDIDEDTLVFDTLVNSKADFDRHFTKPLRESWHFRLLG